MLGFYLTILGKWSRVNGGPARERAARRQRMGRVR